MLTLMYHNPLVLTAFSCATNSVAPYQIKGLVVRVRFFITMMYRKVTKKEPR